MQTHTILVVDDDLINRKTLAKVLQDTYKTVTANSGQEALDIMRREHVSLVITDQQMPGMTGTELISSIRAVDPEVVCMLMSAVNDTEVFIDAVTRLHAVRIVNKPWNAANVLRDVQSSLERYEKLKKTKEALRKLKLARQNLDKVAKKEEA